MNAIKGKVALITGGSAGLGLQYAKELLRNGLKAVTLADVNGENGESALQEIRNEFGPNRALFVKTDVTDKEQFQDAFKSTITAFKNIDILINNAGIMNDAIWEREIGINFVGTIFGCLLALENYLPKYKSGAEGIIVNVSSTTGLEAFDAIPVYVATKHAIITLTRSWGMESHYLRTKVRCLALCPGATNTSLSRDGLDRNLGPAYEEIYKRNLPYITLQAPEYVAKALIHVINNGKNGSVWIAEDSEQPYEVIIPTKQQLQRK